MFKRLITNCDWRFLKFKIEIIVNIMEIEINPKTKGSLRSIITEPSSPKIVGNQMNNAPITKAETIKYTV